MWLTVEQEWVEMRRKNGKRTMAVPAAAAAENPALPSQPPEDEDLPAAKKQRLQASLSFSTAANGVTTDPTDDTPTVPMTPAAILPSAASSRIPRRSWKSEEDAKLMEAVKNMPNIGSQLLPWFPLERIYTVHWSHLRTKVRLVGAVGTGRCTNHQYNHYKTCRHECQLDPLLVDDGSA